MTAGLSSPRGSNIDAVVARNFHFVLAVEFVGCTCVVLFLTCSWSIVGFHSNLNSCGGTYFLENWTIGRQQHVSSLLGNSLDPCDLVLWISSWNSGTDPWVRVPVCIQMHVVFALQRGEKIQAAWDPSLLAVWQQIIHHLVGLCVWWSVVHRLVALLSWWMAPRVPLPRSGLNCAPDCCLLGAEM